MVMATCGTFDYKFVVPDGSFGRERQMQGTLRKPIQGDQERLLGDAPCTFRISQLHGFNSSTGSIGLSARADGIVATVRI